MKKIKPEVIGYTKIYCDGYHCDIVFEREELAGSVAFAHAFPEHGLIHKNGKPKFRLAYKRTDNET